MKWSHGFILRDPRFSYLGSSLELLVWPHKMSHSWYKGRVDTLHITHFNFWWSHIKWSLGFTLRSSSKCLCISTRPHNMGSYPTSLTPYPLIVLLPPPCQIGQQKKLVWPKLVLASRQQVPYSILQCLLCNIIAIIG